MFCKLCLKNKRLINAHIIPLCFFKEIRVGSSESPVEYSSVPGHYPKRSPIGSYDQAILCKECDGNILGLYDRYACKVLLQSTNDFEPIKDPDGRIGGYAILEVDYEKLKLFFLSVLWRASISSRSEFSKVSLGDLEEELRNRILNKNPGDSEVFSVFIWRFKELIGHKFLLDPYKETIDSALFYRFYLGAGYGFNIKEGKGRLPLSNHFYPLFLKEGNPVLIMLRNFQSSKELQVVMRGIIANNKRK